MKLVLGKKWRPGRDSDPGPAGDSRIYWTELYYLGFWVPIRLIQSGVLKFYLRERALGAADFGSGKN